jgi:hypothetical protein
MRREASERRALAVPAFRLFLTARAISWAGNTVTLVAMPILVYQLTGSPALTGLLTAIEALPYLAFGLPAGALADRWNRRRVLVVASDTVHRHVHTWLRRHIPSDAHAFVTDVTSGYAQLNLQGPRSRDLLQSLTDEDLSNEAFPFRTARELDIGYALSNRFPDPPQTDYRRADVRAPVRPLTPQEIEQHAEPMSPEQAQRRGIVEDTAIQVEDEP